MSSLTSPTQTDPSTSPTPTDPTATLVALSSLDFLLIELVPMAYRITQDLALRDEEWSSGSTQTARRDVEGSSSVSGIAVSGGSVSGTSTSLTSGGANTATGGLTATATATATVDEEEAREAVFHRLESLGYRVGLGIVERISRNTPRPTTPLDTIKFLCKDLWTLLFRKQIDNLKTNHRGIYVLTDNTFKPLTRMSFDTRRFPAAAADATTLLGGGDPNSLARVQPFLYFPAGLIRGCLASLGIQATVQAECTGLPGATFQIRTVGAKA
ncbi:transport protein particle component [Sporormia fimetaria CBS 119925]|uniref:Transport protein particle component n=1 Tax=Sporormia fimetaria CBS 119925 TaxID=1340428 RepID=A0A6A6VI37_9PLEO|nr:transport protein particle component [Sporormia fimetaria CBS 119925]